MLATLLLAATVVATGPCAGVKNVALCRDLLEIYDRDSAARAKNVKPAEAKKIDASNLSRIEAILNQFDWPGKSLVGEKASDAAWTVVQHADLATQKRYLDLMIKAAEAKEFSPLLAAKAADRIAITEGKPQIYGTDKNAPIDDEQHVNDRRAKLGLPPLKTDE